MLSQDSGTGKCCLSNSNDDCLKDYFYCSNNLQSSFSYSKYAMCSYNATLCGNQQRIVKTKNTPISISTGVEMKNVDVCPYQIVTDSALPFNNKVEIKINSLINSEIYLLIGDSMSAIDTSQSLLQDDTVTFESTKIGFLIVRATYDNPYVQFTVKNVEIIPTWGWITIIVGSSVLYFVLLLVGLIYLTKHLTLKKLREMQSPNIVYFLKKKVFQYQQLPKDEPQQKKKDDFYPHGRPPKAPQISINKMYENTDRYTPHDDYNPRKQQYQPEKKQSVEELVIPTHSNRPNSHENLMGQTDTGLGRMETAAGDSRGNLQSQGMLGFEQPPRTRAEQPKVTIRPYKINFD